MVDARGGTDDADHGAAGYGIEEFVVDLLGAVVLADDQPRRRQIQHRMDLIADANERRTARLAQHDLCVPDVGVGLKNAITAEAPVIRTAITAPTMSARV